MLEVIFKQGSRWLTDLLDSLVSVLKVLVQSRFGVRLPARQRPGCSILGNGPSLRQSLNAHTDFLRTTELVCVNNFASAPEYAQLQPSNYVLLDPAFFHYSAEHNGRADIARTFDHLLRLTAWPLNLYVPQYARRSYLVQTLCRQNPNLTPVFFNYTIVRGFTALRHWLFRHNLGMPQSQNVLAATLFLCINRRFDQIFLFGADHSWHEEIRISDTNQLLMKQVHFYDKPQDLAYVPVGGAGANTARMSAQFASLAKAFYGYEVLKQYADSVGVRVLNASAKSYVDAFERVVPTAVTS